METPIVSPDDIVGLPNFNVCSYLNRPLLSLDTEFRTQ